MFVQYINYALGDNGTDAVAGEYDQDADQPRAKMVRMSNEIVQCIIYVLCNLQLFATELCNEFSNVIARFN